MHMVLHQKQQQTLAMNTTEALKRKWSNNYLQSTQDWNGRMRDRSSTCHALTAVSENDAWVPP